MSDNLSSSSRSSSVEDPPASKAQCTPEGNKFKFVPNRGQKGKKIKRIFQKNWKEGREWLQYDATMWCSTMPTCGGLAGITVIIVFDNSEAGATMVKHSFAKSPGVSAFVVQSAPQ
eukprot:EG_transcript_42345